MLFFILGKMFMCFTIVYHHSILMVVMLCLGSTPIFFFLICCFLCKVELKPQKKLTLRVKYYSMSNRLINVKYFLVFVQKRL